MTLQTDIGQLVGTVQYVSPEQCAADPHDIDTRSDVYSLGVVLYELMCEQLPYDLKRVPIHEATRVIREQSPPRPSSCRRALSGDVETIVMKALDKDRARRYQSAAETVLLASHAELDKRLGQMHHRTQTCIRTLMELYEATDKPEEAAKWRALERKKLIPAKARS